MPSCSHQSLTVEEAKQVTMSVRQRSFVPPPRRSYDIIDLLKRPEQADSKAAQELLAKVRSLPTDDVTTAQLANFYLERGRAAFQLGLMQEARQDFQKALYLGETSRISSGYFKLNLSYTESVFGNYRRTVALASEAAQESGSVAQHAYVVAHYARMGDIERAREWRRKGRQIYIEKVQRWPAASQNPYNHFGLARMEAVLLEAEGNFKAAEPYRQKMIKAFGQATGGKTPIFEWFFKLLWIDNLAKQGRLLEAEIEARRAIEEVVAYGAKGTFYSASACNLLGKILVDQDRLQEARIIIEAAIEMVQRSGIPIDTPYIGDARIELVELLALQGNYAAAADQFDRARDCFGEPDFFMGRLLFRPNFFAALILAGRPAEAQRFIQTAHQKLVDRIGQDHPQAFLLQALEGMANDGLGNGQAAAADYETALPALLSAAMFSESDIRRSWLVRVVLETYLDHLARTRRMADEMPPMVFKITEALRHSAVQQAIIARSARGSITDPAMKDLTRREQDARRQVDVLEVQLSNTLAAPSDQVDPNLVEKITTQLEQLKAARQTLQSEILAANPHYADFTEPKLMSIEDTQALLRPSEALVAIYTTRHNTYVWGISQQGNPRAEIIPAGRATMTELVDRIRISLDAGPARLGDIPGFDLTAAHQLYQLLLAPVAAAWSDAAELLVVTNTPLDRLPIGILPVSKTVPTAQDDTLLFGEYRQVDWLIRHAAINRHPSVAAFTTLRRTPVQEHSRQPFAGFGDPVFDPERETRATLVESSSDDFHIRERGRDLRVRGVRVTESGSLDDAIQSTRLQDLVPLPDTAEEIESIAQALQASPQAAIFLGKDASEARIKSMNLANRRVIAFATHALVPGDLDGLLQPALALSAPEATGESEDGLLTMGEIMTLDLDADWVVLSACNTGAGDGAGAEAISGLGLAFFYAGSRALLVSLWPVETTSARLLTTGIFQRQQADPQLGRSAALQQSILDLIDSPGLSDPATGRIAASYAHPLFWAPFILVGEGGGDQ